MQKSFIQYTAMISIVMSLLLTSCGESDAVYTEPQTPPETELVTEKEPKEQDNPFCNDQPEGVNIAAILYNPPEGNSFPPCNNLRDYNLFADNKNPTENPNGSGLPYDLVTSLFTDYATKYRFLYIPEGKQAQYTSKEVLDFPIGTIISKTFAMPADTAMRGFEHERLMETRLLIRRDSGWLAIPYVWNSEGTNATRQVFGPTFEVSIKHGNEDLAFTYAVPDTSTCKRCHTLEQDDGSHAFTPIGPKARLLNKDYDYADGTRANQLAYWQQSGILADLPLNENDIPSQLAYNDEDELSLAGKTEAQLLPLAKSYLDINCAHCHRPEGFVASRGLYLEFEREFAGDKYRHGVCKPLNKEDKYGYGYTYSITPGSAETSFMHGRINTRDPILKMPEAGREVIHTEGVALITAWINSMDIRDCGN